MLHSHFLSRLVSTACLALALPGAVASGAQDRPPDAYAPRGELVDVGGRRLHVFTTGTGGPTVVVEVGSGDFSFDWALVQEPVSRFARVCTYDRAGYAWSDSGPKPRTFRQLALELHEALRRGGVPGPYVLVGQSYGGFLVRAFAKYYPRDVAGMVLVDAVHEDSRVIIGGRAVRIRDMARGRAFPAPRARTPRSRIDVPLIYPQDALAAPELEPPFDRLPDDARRLRAWAESQPRLREARGAEMDWSPEELARMARDPRERRHPLGDIPLVVLSRGVGGYEDGPNYSAKELDAERLRLQARLATLSRNSRHVVDPHAGHNVHLDDPAAVVGAIEEVVEAVRSRRALRGQRAP